MMRLTPDCSPGQCCLKLYALKGNQANNKTEGVEYVQPLL
jgi:hypothetical protein